ncbi:hypothetical protein ACFU7Y_21965 [Kitasatospora sp. NPDC057542]|uniref:hypothetical protein n=1 Tax=Kitasatospora sp. NPDC057542 TaxID=3346162 RepID=UPI0036A13B88
MEISLVDESVMRSRWDDVEDALRRAFAGSHFNDEGYTVDNPINYTRSVVEGRLGPGFKHLLALDDAGSVIGGFFCIQTELKGSTTAHDIGWIFAVPEIDRPMRREMIDTFMQRAFATLREAGFRRIESNMGTRAGGASLSRHYGFVHSPVPGNDNRWVKEL